MLTISAMIATTSLLLCGDGGSSGWTIVASYPIPEGASGLAWDGRNLYCGIYGVDGGHVYQIDPSTGAYEFLFDGEHEDAFGLTHDGTFLWTTDHQGSSTTPATALKLDWNGNVIDQIVLPDHYMSGIAHDNGAFWVTRYYPDPGHLYKMSADGVILDEFDGPDDQPWDLAMDGSQVWVADYWGDTLYAIDTESGSVVTSHASEGVDPSGIVWDGRYLWYCDNGVSYEEDLLYKVDLQGGGSPEILIADPTHAFGNVVLDDLVVWEVDVVNLGSADLMVSEVTFEKTVDLRCTAGFPVTVPPGESAQLPIEYAPSAFGPLDTSATVVSNDPIHPYEELTITGHGVYAEATIDILETKHNFGEVRTGAHTRWFIEVANQGEQQLVIKNVTSNNELFYIDPQLELPITLNTLASAQIGVWFNTPSVCFCAGQIDISSNDQTQSPALVLVTGSGLDSEYPIGTDLWSHVIEGSWDNSPKAMAPIPDVSGDGRDDLIVCSEDYTVRCFNGNADGHGDVLWAHEIYSGSVYSDKGLDVVDDVDGDGFKEVIVGATGGARLIRMLSGRTGNELWSYHTDAVGDGGWVYQVDGSRDFNGDGTNDVVACAGDDGSGSGPKRAYCLDGSNGSLLWQLPLGGPVFAAIAVDDFTNDGIPDVVVGASNENRSQGCAVGIDGATGSQAWSFNVSGSSVWALAQIGDISDDGVNDVIIGDFSTGQFHALDATTGGQEYAGGGLGTLTGFQRIEDVDGDGHPEIVPEHFANAVRLISGRTGESIWSTTVVDNPTVTSPIADVSGDGINDVVVGTLFSSNYTYFLDGVDGDVLHAANFGTPLDAITVIPDVVGDGSWELVAGGRDGTVACLSGGIDALVFDPADFNHDGIVDGFDLTVLLSEWGRSGSFADLNEDGIVDGADLTMLLAAWTS